MKTPIQTSTVFTFHLDNQEFELGEELNIPKNRLVIQSALGHDHDHENLSSDDDAFFPTMGDEIEKKLFPLVPSPYCMYDPYVNGQSSEP
ncbi:hypothetical protein Tco_0736022 [Tanacetum coccineum]